MKIENQKQDTEENSAKWQSERMYSEEDLRKAFENGVGSGKYQQEYGIKGSMNFEDWFEQFKKKQNGNSSRMVVEYVT